MSARGTGLDPGRLASQLAGIPFVRTVEVRESTGSTNDDLRRLAAAGAPEGTVVVAGRQSAGRGRLGRTWDSPDALGLYLSVLLRPAEPSAFLGRYSIATAVAVCAACRAIAGDGVLLKWPNDVLVRGRKLSGILAEVRQGPLGAELAVGIGVNVHQTAADFSPDVATLATSLAMECGGAPVDLASTAVAVLRALEVWIGVLRAGDWPAVAAAFLRYAPDATGRRVRLASGREGVTDGLDASGALAVATESGIVLAHASESVTLITG